MNSIECIWIPWNSYDFSQPFKNLYKPNRKPWFWRGPVSAGVAPRGLRALKMLPRWHQPVEYRAKTRIPYPPAEFCGSHGIPLGSGEFNKILANSERCAGIQGIPGELREEHHPNPNPRPRSPNPWKTFTKPIENQGSGGAQAAPGSRQEGPGLAKSTPKWHQPVEFR